MPICLACLQAWGKAKGLQYGQGNKGILLLAKEGEKRGMNGEEGALSLTFCNIDWAKYNLKEGVEL